MHIELGEFDEEWGEVRAADLTIPSAMFNPHDVAVTSGHAVFFSPQLAFDNTSYILGFKGPGQCVEFEDKPMQIYLQPRSGGPAQVLPFFPFSCDSEADGLISPSRKCTGAAFDLVIMSLRPLVSSEITGASEPGQGSARQVWLSLLSRVDLMSLLANACNLAIRHL